jgi:hypothetical protein
MFGVAIMPFLTEAEKRLSVGFFALARFVL